MNIFYKKTIYFLFFMHFLFIAIPVNSTPGVIRIDLTNCYKQLVPEIQGQLHLYLDEFNPNPYLEIFENNIESLRVMRLKEHIETILQVSCYQQTLLTLPYQRFLPSDDPNPLVINILGVTEYYGRYERKGSIYFNVPLITLVLAITPPQTYTAEESMNAIADRLGTMSMK